jgi:hypothetical protein
MALAVVATVAISSLLIVSQVIRSDGPAVRDLADMYGDRDVRIAYRTVAETGWESVDGLELTISRLDVEYIESERGCDDPTYLSFLAKDRSPERPPSGETLRPVTERLLQPPLPEPVIYRRDYAALTLVFRQGAGLLDLFDLDRLPNGFIVELRLVVDDAQVVDGGTRTALEVPGLFQTDGLRLAAFDGPVPVCERFIASMRFDLDGNQWLTGTGDTLELLADVAKIEDENLKGKLVGETTAPEAVFPALGGRLDVMDGIWVEVPRGAVTDPMVVRVAEMDWQGKPKEGDDAPVAELPDRYQSVDFVFRNAMRRIGIAYELKPDAFVFERPIKLALPLPTSYAVPAEVLDSLDTDAFPPELVACLRELDGLRLSQSGLSARVRSCVQEKLPSDHPLYEEFADQLPRKIHEVPLHHPQSVDLYTWSPAYRLWLPDVPRLLPAHESLVTDALDRAIAAEAASPRENVEPDFSAIPEAAYAGLMLDRINKQETAGYLVTTSNHFCIKSLFADLNVFAVEQAYEPLLEGALDDMCQTTDGFGFPRDSNEEVHCGGDPASENDRDRRARKTGRIIQEDGVALRLRGNVRSFFDDFTCPPPPDPNYCYDFDDFVDDVNWAVTTWQEAINRDPDGGLTPRFTINCTQIEDDDEGCSGREFDIGIRDILTGDAVGRAYGRNFTIDEILLTDPIDNNGATDSREGRARLRSTMLHELGHALGLDHWAGAGTLMSYSGRWRRNHLRYNLCAPYSEAEIGGANYFTTISDQICAIPEMAGGFGTTYELPPGSTNPDFHWARINRLTCTDVQRIRQQVNAADTWTSTEPVKCEIMAEQTEYAAVEREMYDSANLEAYTVMELDLRFRHCGSSPQFHRMEFELLGVNAENDSDAVTNLYRDPANPTGFIYSIPLAAPDADGFYDVTLTLDSRQLSMPTTTDYVDSAGVTTTVYPTFSEYLAGRNLAGLDDAVNPIALSYPNLAMVIRTFVETTDGGDTDEYVAGSTGLLRSPILMPVEAPVTFSIAGLELDGEDLAAELPSTMREDLVTGTDLFPYIDDSRQKPNVGKVYYLILPPRADGAEQMVEAALEWQIPDQQYRSWEDDPKLLWVHSVDVTRGDVPTIEDWEFLDNDWPGGWTMPLNAPPDTGFDNPAVAAGGGDPCAYLSDTFDLAGILPEDPLRPITTPNDNRMQAWDLFRVRFNYEYVAIPGCNNPSNVCVGGALNTGCVQPGAPVPDRFVDVYVSLSGPTGAIVQPRESSLCLYNVCRTKANSYGLSANLEGMSRLEDWFDGHAFEVRFHARGDIVDIQVEDADPHESGRQHEPTSDWLRVFALGPDESLDETLRWYNNSSNQAYQVELQYRHCEPSDSDPSCADDANWSEPRTLDTLRLRFDKHNNGCDGDDFRYQNAISLGCS